MSGAKVLTCAKGHRWDGDGSVAQPLCPICGNPGSSAQEPTISSLTLDGKPTGDQEATLPRPTAGDSQPVRPDVRGFDIERELGRGGMGVVYLARQKDLNRYVALKMILSGLHAGAQERERFRIEAQAAAQLQHPNIVQIYEIGEAEGRPYLALEYVPGGSLAAQLYGQPWPPRDAVRLIEPLSRAIHHAHQRGIIHRDLKPANVLLNVDSTPQAEPIEFNDPYASGALHRIPHSALSTPKITDFGLAKLIQEVEARSGGLGPTRTGAVMGTPSYIAPEQASGRAGSAGPEADVYSLGSILYELLTGRPPFRGETPLDTVLQVMSDDPVPPRRLQPKIPRDLETICLKCLEKDPRKRYPSATALADDLTRFLKGESILARPASAPQRMVKWARRRPAAALLVLGSILGFVAVLAASLVVNFKLTDAADRERRQAEDAKLQRSLAMEQKREAEKAKSDAELKAENARRSNYALQLAQVAAMIERNPDRAALMLEDEKLCPEDLRDFTWGYLHRLCRRERMALEGHQLNVSALAFAPDGSWLASVSWDRSLRLWNAALGFGLQAATAAHDGMIMAMAISPDGQTLATAGDDRLVKIWSVHRPVMALGVHGVFLWPFPNLREQTVLRGHQRGVRCLAFSPDGEVLATGGYDQLVKLWNPQNGSEMATLRGHTRVIWSLAFSPDGKLLASGSEDASVRLWDVPGVLWNFEQPPPDTLMGHRDSVVALAFSPDGKTLASGGSFDDQSVCLWDVARRRERARLKGHTRAVFALAFAPDGQTLASGSADGSIRFWDPTSGRERTVFARTNSRFRLPPLVQALAFSPDSLLLASGGADRLIHLWELDEHRAETYSLPSAQFRLGRLNADASRVVYVDGSVVISYDWTQKKSTPLVPPIGICQQLAAGGDLIATLDTAGRIRIWRNGQPLPPGSAFPNTRSIAVSADGKRFALGGANGSLRLFNAESGREIKSLAGAHRGPINVLAFSPDGQTLASGGEDREIRLWSTTDLTPRKTLSGSAYAVHALAFAPSSQTLASGSKAGLVRLWDVATGNDVASSSSHSDTVTTLAFSADGRTLASGSDDRSVKLWDAATGQERATITGHSDHILNLAFNPAATALATVTRDGVLKVWRADGR